MSNLRVAFVQAAKAQSWTEAADSLNGLAMFEMFPALAGLSPSLRTQAISQCVSVMSSRGWTGSAARIQWAGEVVQTRRLPAAAPDDLPADQVADARRFLAAGPRTSAHDHKLIMEYLESLRGAEQPDSLVVAIRDMTGTQLGEAFAWVLANGGLTPLGGDPAYDAFFKVDKDGDVITRLSAASGTGLADPMPKISFKSEFNGIELLYVTSNNPLKSTKQLPQNVDPRGVVFLWKLTTMLISRYDATALYHIGYAFSGTRTDAHGDGRAIDFAGIASPTGALTVHLNWFKQPVRLPVANGSNKAGDILPAWPGMPYDQTTYRLTDDNTGLDPMLNPRRAKALFQDVYNLGATEMTDGGPAGTRTAIGRSSVAILHPDYPKGNAPKAKNGREAHNDHIHINIGPVR